MIGLGNPGEKYSNSRHNAGFLAVDQLRRKRRGSRWIRRKNYFESRISLKNHAIVMIKPVTYMNLSGIAVAHSMNVHECRPSDLIVIHDDLDLEPGRVKIKVDGGDGGHNGLASIFQQIDSRNFTRIRIGIGHPDVNVTVTDYVLNKFESDNDETIYKQSIARAAEAVESIFYKGLTKTMSHFNRRSPNDESNGENADAVKSDSENAKALRKGESP